MSRTHTDEQTALKRAVGRRLRESSGQDYPSVVYHFTTLDTAIKILDTFELWCTNVAFANDPTEGVYGQSIIDRICVQDPDLLLEGARRLVADDIQGYAASFCAKPDELTQWRTYGASGRGVAIGIDTAALLERSNVALLHVEYDLARQERLINSILNIFRARMLASQSAPRHLAKLAAVLTEAFVVIRAMLKHPSYYSEQEYRLVDALPRDDRRHDVQLEFFQRDTHSVPFFRVDLRASAADGASQPIREVWIGPCAVASAEESLQNTAAYTARVFETFRSRVPMRCD